MNVFYRVRYRPMHPENVWFEYENREVAETKAKEMARLASPNETVVLEEVRVVEEFRRPS